MGSLIWIGVVILIISIVLFALGARGAAGMTASVGRFILIAGIVLFLIFLILSFLGGGPATV